MHITQQTMISVHGGHNYALALSNRGAWLLNVLSSLTVELPYIASDGQAAPLAFLCEDMDFAAIASSSRIVRGYSICQPRVKWERMNADSISGLLVLRQDEALIVGGESPVALGITEGSVLNSKMADFHSHVGTGGGCVCVRSKTDLVYYFERLSDPVRLKTPSPRVRFGVSRGDLVALHFFGLPQDVFLFHSKSGRLLYQYSIPKINLVDSLSFDQSGNNILLVGHGANSKRVEVWKLALTADPFVVSVVSVLPEGLGQVGWVFHDRGTYLLGRNGGLAEVSSGRLIRDNWMAWS